MLNVLDEKWKDHLYDLDQLRAAIHYRSWGQKDPLIEYKQEAYTMFVDLMSDIHHTFTERFLRAQLVFNPQEFAGPEGAGAPAREPEAPRKPTRRYNALGILEDIVEEPAAAQVEEDGAEPEEAREPAALEAPRAVARGASPMVVGAGRARSLTDMAGGGPRAQGAPDFTNVGRNDPCPCGSGKKYKKCHGAGA
jgi:preprotein translocase subunit SecA